VAQIQRRHQALDGTALARSVPTLEQRAHGRAQLLVAELAAEGEPQLGEAVLDFLQALLVLLLVELEA
jgi:hypothetical protein